MTATVKRRIPLHVLEGLVDAVENDIRYKYRGPVPSTAVGDQVLIRLQEVDKVAYIRFASVYKDFKDLEEFNEELEKLVNSSEVDQFEEETL